MGVGGGCSVVFTGPNPPLPHSETHLLGRNLVREPYEFLIPAWHTSNALQWRHRSVSVRVSHRKLLTSSGSSVPREIPTGPATICQVCFHHSLRNFLLTPPKPLSIFLPPSFPATSAVNRPGVNSRSGHTSCRHLYGRYLLARLISDIKCKG